MWHSVTGVQARDRALQILIYGYCHLYRVLTYYKVNTSWHVSQEESLQNKKTFLKRNKSFWNPMFCSNEGICMSSFALLFLHFGGFLQDIDTSSHTRILMLPISTVNGIYVIEVNRSKNQLRMDWISAKAQAPNSLFDISLRRWAEWAKEISKGGRPGRFFDSAKQ